MPNLDIADATYISCPPVVVAAAVADSARWSRWWPDLTLEVSRDRRTQGVQWAVTGALTGSMEIWLEPVGTGTVVHWFLRVDFLRVDQVGPARRGRARQRRARRLRERQVRAWKVHAFALKDGLERAEGVR